MNQVKQIYVDEVFETFNSKDSNCVFIDVREPDEWELGVMPGVEKVSLGDFPNHIDKLDKNKKYIMVCRSGARSNRAGSLLIEKGFSDVSNFQGGMLSWYDEDYPLE